MTDAPPSPSDKGIFQPTWGRGFFALALAIAGFFFPQEVPLVWYPLNEPGNDINYLEISCAANANGQVQIFYNAGKGFNELDSIRWPIAPTEQTYTYTFPLPDAPLTELLLNPVANGGVLTIRQMRIIDRRSTEMRRFTREMFTPVSQIAAIAPLPDGWKIVSEPGANAPSTRLRMDAPILAKGINHRNLLRCLYSSGYLAFMLWILLLAVLFTLHRPRSWREAGSLLGFMAALALLFAIVGNRGLIKNSVRYARYVAPPVAPGALLEIDLRIDHPAAAQLFWDVGRGFNEADSLRQTHETHTGLQTLRFALPPGPLKALRFDPLDGAAKIAIRGLRLVDTAGRTMTVLPIAALEARQDVARHFIANDILEIETLPHAKDPILIFKPDAMALINGALGVPPAPVRRTGTDKIKWTMLNVCPGAAQADCHLLQMPDGSTVLIDAADAADAPGTALAQLRNLEIHRISLVVISHFHRDHYGRLLDLLNAGITVDRVVLNVPDKECADREIPWGCDWNDVQAVLAELRLRNIPFSTPKAGDRLFSCASGPGVTAGIDVLCCNDGRNTPIGPTDVNDTSIILRVFNGPTRALFTGDLNHALGSYLATSDIDLKADVLKAPHHGAESTVPNAFYDRIGAKALLVPSSKPYWQSARSMRTRNYFAERHIPAYVSGIDGVITVELTKDGFSIGKRQ